MRAFLRQRWFLIALVGLLAGGHWLGAAAPGVVTRWVDGVLTPNAKSVVIALVLFLMSVTMDSRRLWVAAASPAPVVWAIVVSGGLMPLASSLLAPLQWHPDLAVGLLIAASVPCTLAAVSVWTRRAGGNEAISLLVTLVTNCACFLYTPFWLQLFTRQSISLDAAEMTQRLIVTALLPTLFGQICRCRAGWAALADRWQTPLSVAALLGILATVFAAACEAGRRLAPDAANGTAAPTAAAILVVAISCIALHLGAMGVGLAGARAFRFPRPDRIAVAFASSQKTLPIGVLIATDPRNFGSQFPWAIYPMLLFHASQLFIDTAIADRFRTSAPAETDASNLAADATGAIADGELNGEPLNGS